ncbi:hypothetical protein D9619_002689 [Psilocybe cf. subviscida]|uniref:Uncharacterized protein n=1 Tax=Psilocybe cf. subviscida TaxID=2480587 RepID=A0A8H5AWL5_9AGAR|nr:hypothetical protein D9619_002689 [Psilocybe cf. subviscida]
MSIVNVIGAETFRTGTTQSAERSANLDPTRSTTTLSHVGTRLGVPLASASSFSARPSITSSSTNVVDPHLSSPGQSSSRTPRRPSAGSTTPLPPPSSATLPTTVSGTDGIATSHSSLPTSTVTSNSIFRGFGPISFPSSLSATAPPPSTMTQSVLAASSQSLGSPTDASASVSSSDLSSSLPLDTPRTFRFIIPIIETVFTLITVNATVTDTTIAAATVIALQESDKFIAISTTMMMSTTILGTERIFVPTTIRERVAVPTTVVAKTTFTETATVMIGVDPSPRKSSGHGMQPSPPSPDMSRISGKNMGLPDIFSLITAASAVCLCLLVVFLLYKRSKERKEYNRIISELKLNYA